MTTRLAMSLAGVFGLLAILAGTFGAHVFDTRLPPDMLEVFEIGVRYHMYHALAILACASCVERIGPGGTIAIWCFAAGTFVFSGALYALAISGQRWLGAIAPMGGVFLMIGWGALLFTGRRPAP